MVGSDHKEVRGLEANAPDLFVPQKPASWAHRKVVVIGGSRGIGKRIVEFAHRRGARVLAVARKEGPLRQLVQQSLGVRALALDATNDDAPSRVFEVFVPDVLVVCAGALPRTAAIHDQTWPEFAVNWETDVKIAFQFCKAALLRPLPAGSSVVLMSSTAALGGSPIMGGYAGAKRTQMFIANYAQKESDRLELGIRFVSLAPFIVPETQVGKQVLAEYARYTGIPAMDLVQAMESPPSTCDVAAAVIEIVMNPNHAKENEFLVSGQGLESLSSWQNVELRQRSAQDD
jgi:NAD(P)-dependent dehydrogenase (short-subunit alcohol dehydrogenase family)